MYVIGMKLKVGMKKNKLFWNSCQNPGEMITKFSVGFLCDKIKVIGNFD